KLKIDMLRTSMGSCLGARDRTSLRSGFLKLFSRCLVFIVIPYISTLTGLRSVTSKQSWDLLVPLLREDVRLAESAGACYSTGLIQVRRGPTTTACHEIQLESDRSTVHRLWSSLDAV